MQPQTFTSSVSLIVHGLSVNRLEISRLMAAAIINPDFCSLLLKDPQAALDGGFQGETFFFTEEERDLILSIRAGSLAELAEELERSISALSLIQTSHPIQPAEFFGV